MERVRRIWAPPNEAVFVVEAEHPLEKVIRRKACRFGEHGKIKAERYHHAWHPRQDPGIRALCACEATQANDGILLRT